MTTPFPSKTRLQMQREATQRGKPKAPPLSPPDSTKRPLLGRDPEPDLAATAEWRAHIQAGRIEVR